ncbi:MAG: RNase adapter RapZ [Slackia sp.]
MNTSFQQDDANDLVFVTGMSGAGRTEAMHSFEDLGYFCIDNLPASLIPNLLDTARGADGHMTRKLAVVCDARNKAFFADLQGELKKIADRGIPFRVVFLDAGDDKLVARYKASRRRHPLCEEGMTIAQGIAAERALLFDLRNAAHDVIDTTEMLPMQLRTRIESCSPKRDGRPPLPSFFRFKHGAPSMPTLSPTCASELTMTRRFAFDRP